MRTFPTFLSTALLVLLCIPAANANELTGTLKKIKDSGAISVGFRDAAIPFSYYGDSSGKPIGYSQDIQRKIIEAIEKQLNIPSLTVKYNLVTSQTRIPLVQNGTIDLECGATTNNIERQQQVAFSIGIFESNTRFLTKKASPYKEFSDLKGKNVVTTAGTTSERLLKSMNSDKQMGMNVIAAKDHGESFQMLETGRAVAFMMDDAMLAGEMAKSKKPDEWAITGADQSREIYGCMLRKDDPSFKKVVDDAIIATFASGEIGQIYSKWFEQPIPPKGLSLNFPMSAKLKELIANPNDKPAP
ncbi:MULTISPECIES: glutamate/aspartate ABC transporter substrate-binding protein [unclassified Pseudomonas]|jgi:glutamate/aspartate transport system substrate-binding protein|uniref:glutamate/aspartate ABC transporter substrate-binding protein n=1 Tax=Pseudomonas sp. A-R-26 TaxID=2832404 RepID=UPI001CBB2AAF